MVRLVMAVLVMLMVAGCDPKAPVSALLPLDAGVSMLTLPQTKKTPGDHLMSAATGRDCSIIHYEQDGAFCQDPPKVIDRRNLYCIKTLGGVECHERANPYYGGERTLGSPPPRPIEPE